MTAELKMPKSALAFRDQRNVVTLRTLAASGHFDRGPIIFIHTRSEPALFADMRKGLPT